MGKLLGTLLLDNLKIFLMSKIRKEQFSFRTHHCTTEQLTKVTDKVITNANRRQKTTMVFLDLEKAFDRIRHEGLIHKLITHVTRSAPAGKQNKIFSRKKNLPNKTRRLPTSIEIIKSGVSQGSSLSFQLFTAYIHQHECTNTVMFWITHKYTHGMLWKRCNITLTLYTLCGCHDGWPQRTHSAIFMHEGSFRRASGQT